MSHTEQLRTILGVGPNSTINEIKQAYRDLVQVWHPDRFVSNPRLQQKAQERLKEINRAYSILLASLQSCRQDIPQEIPRESNTKDFDVRESGDDKAFTLSRLYGTYPVIAFALIATIIFLLVLPSIKGDLAEVPYNLGKMHYQAGHYDQALTMYKIALWLNPDNSKAYSGMGEVYYALTRLEKAKDAFLRAANANVPSRAHITGESQGD